MNICGEEHIYMPDIPDCTDCDAILAGIDAEIEEALRKAKKYTDDELDDYTPRGTVSAPAVVVNRTSDTVNSMSSAGTLPSLSATYTAANERLKINWSAGSLPTSASKTVVTAITGAAASAPIFTGVKRNA